MSAVPFLFGENAKATLDKCIAVEDQLKVWEKAESLGKKISGILSIQ